VPLYENHDLSMPLTRADDEERRLALLRYLRDQGMVVGSEVGCDFGVPVLDWSPTGSKHTPGQSVPLWALVFQDAHISFSTALSTDADVPEAAPDDLERFRAGQCALLVNGQHLAHVRVSAGNWGRIRPMLGACERYDAWSAQTGGDEMVDHRFLDADELVERVEYAGGAAAVANFAEEPFDVDGRTVPPRDFRVLSD
jgi:hypothetical protein